MRIHEVFPSLQGEGPDVGRPAIFIRLQGCNLACSWCDTGYALMSTTGKEMTVEQVLDEVKVKSRSDYAIITGGEPLVQAGELSSLVADLQDEMYEVAIETNGTLAPPYWWTDVIWDIDHKCPSSGIKVPFNYSWIGTGQRNRIKFVVADKADLDYVEHILPRFMGPGKPQVVISPMIPNTSADYLTYNWSRMIWDFCVANRVRFSLQVHKIVWGSKRGV